LERCRVPEASGREVFSVFASTSCLRSSRSKLQKDPRVGFIDQNNTRWFTFELSCDADLHAALDWLGDAYEGAARRRKSKQ